MIPDEVPDRPSGDTPVVEPEASDRAKQPHDPLVGPHEFDESILVPHSAHPSTTGRALLEDARPEAAGPAISRPVTKDAASVRKREQPGARGSWTGSTRHADRRRLRWLGPVGPAPHGSGRDSRRALSLRCGGDRRSGCSDSASFTVRPLTWHRGTSASSTTICNRAMSWSGPPARPGCVILAHPRRRRSFSTNRGR